MTKSQVLVRGDCVEMMRTLPDASIDAVVCDPPYELSFMGKAWDATGVSFRAETWREVLRVLRPGGYLLAFGGTRTYHRMTCAIEDAGFEIRDCLSWQYGSGFPKSLNVSIAIDKAAGAMGHRGKRVSVAGNRTAGGEDVPHAASMPVHEGVTDDAKRWQGWGTSLKPAWEPIVVARRPLEGTVAANVLKHGTGALNIDGCRVAALAGDDFAKAWDKPRSANIGAPGGGYISTGKMHTVDLSARRPTGGRWPANVILSCPPDCDGDTHAPGCPCATLDAQQDGASRYFNRLPIEADDLVPFLCAPKASRSEREAGLHGCSHPTVKPVAVMRHLVRLCCREGGTVLDPFMGSGTTGIAAVKEGMHFIGMELSEEYVEIARARIINAGGQPDVIP